MANDLNQCMFIGHLGRDPETKYLPSGDAVCNFSIACNWKTKDKEGAEWVRIVAFGKLAEICAKYLEKGKQVFISGRMQTREWEDKGVGKRYTTEVVADRMQMLGGRGGGPAEDEAGDPGPVRAVTPERKAAESAVANLSDDIPFAPIARGISGHAE